MEGAKGVLLAAAAGKLDGLRILKCMHSCDVGRHKEETEAGVDALSRLTALTRLDATSGAPTSYGSRGQGRAVVDYWLATAALLPLLPSLEVTGTTMASQLSDHATPAALPARPHPPTSPTGPHPPTRRAAAATAVPPGHN